MKKLGIGEFKVLLQNYGINIDDNMKKAIINEYNCYHINFGKIFFNIIDNANNFYPVYTVLNNSESAFTLKKDDEGYYLSKGNLNSRIKLNKKIKSYDLEVEDKKLSQIARIKSMDHLGLTLNHFCIHFHQKRECKFCNIGNWPTNINSILDDYIKAIKIYSENKDINHISITTGTVNDTDKGLKNVVSFVRKVRNKGVDLPIAVEFEPTKQYEYLEELKSLGVETVSCNIEMLQNDIRPLLMPGKGLISIDEYYRTWEKCVALFGESQVYTNVLLNSIEYNRNNIINQLRTITSIGVIPSLGLLIPEKGTELENIKLPDIEQQYEYHFYNNAYIQSNKLNPLNAKAGCPRNGAYSPVKEFYVDSLYQDRCIVQQCKTNN